MAFFKMGEATGELAGDIRAYFQSRWQNADGLPDDLRPGSLTGIGVTGLVSHLWGDRD